MTRSQGLGIDHPVGENSQQPQFSCLRRGVDRALRSISHGLDDRRFMGGAIVTAVASAYFAPGTAAMVLIGLTGRQLYRLTHRQPPAQSVPEAAAQQFSAELAPSGAGLPPPPCEAPPARRQPRYSSAREWNEAFMNGEIDHKTWMAYINGKTGDFTNAVINAQGDFKFDPGFFGFPDQPCAVHGRSGASAPRESAPAQPQRPALSTAQYEERMAYLDGEIDRVLPDLEPVTLESLTQMGFGEMAPLIMLVKAKLSARQQARLRDHQSFSPEGNGNGT